MKEGKGGPRCSDRKQQIFSLSFPLSGCLYNALFVTHVWDYAAQAAVWPLLVVNVNPAADARSSF